MSKTCASIGTGTIGSRSRQTFFWSWISVTHVGHRRVQHDENMSSVPVGEPVRASSSSRNGGRVGWGAYAQAVPRRRRDARNRRWCSIAAAVRPTMEDSSLVSDRILSSSQQSSRCRCVMRRKLMELGSRPSSGTTTSSGRRFQHLSPFPAHETRKEKN